MHKIRYFSRCPVSWCFDRATDKCARTNTGESFRKLDAWQFCVWKTTRSNARDRERLSVPFHLFGNDNIASVRVFGGIFFFTRHLHRQIRQRSDVVVNPVFLEIIGMYARAGQQHKHGCPPSFKVIFLHIICFIPPEPGGRVNNKMRRGFFGLLFCWGSGLPDYF